MSSFSLCTFNVENLFMRYKLFGYWPGGKSKKKILSEEEIAEGWGFMPSLMYRNSFKVFDHDGWRKLTARAVKGQDGFPDILCVQEVESMLALRRFNEDFLERYYDKILLIDGHDPRLIDVGVLTKHPIEIARITTHIDDKPQDDSKSRQFLFSRDCLEVELDLGTGRHLTLLVNHLKSKYTQHGTPAEKKKAGDKRLAQAKKVAEIVRERFPGTSFGSEAFAILGDFNDTPDSSYVEPLVEDLGLENIINRLPENERWTHWWDSKNVVSQIDYILLSPALTQSSQTKPYIERRGLSKRAKTTYMEVGDGEKGKQIKLAPDRFPEATNEIEASDHCPVFMKLEL